MPPRRWGPVSSRLRPRRTISHSSARSAPRVCGLVRRSPRLLPVVEMPKKIVCHKGEDARGSTLGVEASSRRPRIANWTSQDDVILVGSFRKQFDLGLMPHGSLHKVDWASVITFFNENTGKIRNKQQLFNRMKVLKQKWAIYARLVAKSGWGWDPVANIPVPGDIDDWNRVIEANPENDLRDKPFLHYIDFEMMFQRSNSRGSNAITHTTLNPEDHCSIGPSDNSPDEGLIADLTIDDEGKDFNDSPSSMVPMGLSFDLGQRSGSFGKRSLAECTTTSQRKGKSAKLEPSPETLTSLVEFGRDRAATARDILELKAKNFAKTEEREMKKDRKYTMEETFQVLADLGDIDDGLYIAAVDILRDQLNRSCFMNIKRNDLRLTWLQKQARAQSEPPAQAQPQNLDYRSGYNEVGGYQSYPPAPSYAPTRSPYPQPSQFSSPPRGTSTGFYPGHYPAQFIPP